METGIHSKLGAQVYMRWVGTRDGERFESMATGPWGVQFDGNVVLLDHADDVQLEHERDDLEKNQGVTDMVLQMCYPVDGKLETWQSVTNAKRGVETGLDVGRNVWCITPSNNGCYRVEAQATGQEIAHALLQQYGVTERWGDGHPADGLLTAIIFRLPA